MTPILKAVAASFRDTDMVLPLALGDLKEQDAKQRVRGGAGPSLTWQVGHLLDGRVKALKFLGVSRENPYLAQYSTAAASDGQDYPAMSDLLAQWRSVAAELRSAMEAATEELLLKEVKGGLHAENTILDKLVFQAWHEAYHVGAVGAIRKELGYPGPAELVMAQMAAAAR